MRLVVEDEAALPEAERDLVALLQEVDGAASRFRGDSALNRANARAGRATPVPPVLIELVAAALEAAAATDGAVDPALGVAMRRIGYDRDIVAVAADGAAVPPAPSAPRGAWQAVRLHRETGLLTVPPGLELDLGATAKAWTADRAARLLSGRYGTGVLVELGGDVRVAGPRDGGWVVRVAERAGGSGQSVRLTQGGLTTSTTTVRAWRRGDRRMHHIVDPATGEPANGPWRTVTVAAASALEANVASTAAIVQGDAAVERLLELGLAARLVHRDGTVVATPGWPDAAGVHRLGPTGSSPHVAARPQRPGPAAVRLGVRSCFVASRSQEARS